MSHVLHEPIDEIQKYYDHVMFSNRWSRPFRSTPFIITFSEHIISEFDIHSFIQLGLRVVQFRMTKITKSDKVQLLELLDRALKWCCEKYEVSAWPVGLTIDVPNAVIKTGLRENTDQEYITIKEGSYIIMTGDKKYAAKCNESRVYMNDHFTLATLKVGAEITIDFGEIMLECSELIDSKNIKCLVKKGGQIKDLETVCIRGVRHVKPALMKSDMEIINFAKEYSFDMVTINSVRYPTTPGTIRALFPDRDPLIISAICEQEGLDNIDEIIKNSDAIILAREFLAYEIADKFKMISIQLYVCGKCRQYGRPLYVSGNILEGQNYSEKLSGCDVNDITSIVQHKAGFVLRKYTDPSHLIKAMRILNSICKSVEPLLDDIDFWRTSYEYKIPVNAAEAAVLAAILLAQQTKSKVIIVPTVSGKTVRQVVHMCQDLFVIAITSTPLRAKQLQLYRGVLAIIYDKKWSRNWDEEMDARIKFAVAYGCKFEVLTHGANYVVLRKSQQSCSYSDHVSSSSVLTEEEIMIMQMASTKAYKNFEHMICPE